MRKRIYEIIETAGVGDGAAVCVGAGANTAVGVGEGTGVASVLFFLPHAASGSISSSASSKQSVLVLIWDRPYLRSGSACDVSKIIHRPVGVDPPDIARVVDHTEGAVSPLRIEEVYYPWPEEDAS